MSPFVPDAAFIHFFLFFLGKRGRDGFVRGIRLHGGRRLPSVVITVVEVGCAFRCGGGGNGE